MIWYGYVKEYDEVKNKSKLLVLILGTQDSVYEAISNTFASYYDSGKYKYLSFGYDNLFLAGLKSLKILYYQMSKWIAIHIFKKPDYWYYGMEGEELFVEKFINKIRDKKADRRIKKYAKKGETMDVHDALRLLTKAYMKECGGSLGYRTLIYTAAEMWQVELKAGCGNNFTEEQVDGPLVQLMPFICEEYDPEHYDKWDIAGGISLKDFKEMCSNVVKGKRYDADTLNALCWGMKKYAEYIAEWES